MNESTVVPIDAVKRWEQTVIGRLPTPETPLSYSFALPIPGCEAGHARARVLALDANAAVQLLNDALRSYQGAFLNDVTDAGVAELWLTSSAERMEEVREMRVTIKAIYQAQFVSTVTKPRPNVGITTCEAWSAYDKGPTLAVTTDPGESWLRIGDDLHRYLGRAEVPVGPLRMTVTALGHAAEAVSLELRAATHTHVSVTMIPDAATRPQLELVK